MQPVNLAEKLALITDYWRPKAVGSVNEFLVKLVKLRGGFVWHAHEVEDELFLVLEGSLRMQFRDRDIVVDKGEFVVVPHGTEHRPVADGEVHVLLIEPASTVNTGTARGSRTRAVEWLQAPEAVVSAAARRGAAGNARQRVQVRLAAGKPTGRSIHMALTFRTIDEYLAGVGDEQRSALEKLRRLIKAAAPTAEECFSYGLPAFRLEGRAIVAFAAWKQHCALYPMSAAWLAAHRDDLGAFELSKGTIRFQPSRPLPAALVRRLVRDRIAENAGRRRR